MTLTMSDTQVATNQSDRRNKPRIDCSYSAHVRGSMRDGKRLDQETVLANLSASGLYLHAAQRIEQGEDLFVLVRLSDQPRESDQFLSIAARGVVVRSVPESDGKFGVAVKFNHYRLL